MTAVKNPIYIIDYYPERNAPKDPSTEQPEPITNVTLANVNISAKAGMEIYFARKIRFEGSKIVAESGRPLTTFEAEVTGLK